MSLLLFAGKTNTNQNRLCDSALGLKAYPTSVFYFFKINLQHILHKLNWFLKIFIQELQQQFTKSVAELLRRILEAIHLVFQPSLFHSSKSQNSSPMPNLQQYVLKSKSYRIKASHFPPIPLKRPTQRAASLGFVHFTTM